jgi:phosphoribosylformimino-5-aminoimidazole carboxamide ribotide isomerase
VGSAAVEDPGLIEAAVARFGGRVAVGLDAQGGVLKIRGWTETANLTALEAARRMADRGVQTLIVTDIERDGTLGGPDIEGTVRLARETECRVVVSGGVSKLADLERLVAHPERSRIEGVIVGKAIYEGRIDVRQALTRLEDA